ncbi:MAG: dephospho-CoA kinase [Candidatus Sericytochromatia bacterium]|nr:dephospho-CoA kinase [Candidatus Sericytochromatia bacterium]
MRLIGLTGGIGTGKSTVGHIAAEAGVPVTDADDLAHATTVVGGPAYEAVIAAFGPTIVASDDSIDRRRLGDIVFADPEALQRLNAIVHPAVRHLMFTQIEQWRQSGVTAAIVIIPLLYESGLAGLFDEVWVASCPPDVQRQRVQQRDGFAMTHVEDRIRAQMPLALKAARADQVIDTGGDHASVAAQVTALLQRTKETT